MSRFTTDVYAQSAGKRADQFQIFSLLCDCGWQASSERCCSNIAQQNIGESFGLKGLDLIRAI